MKFSNEKEVFIWLPSSGEHQKVLFLYYIYIYIYIQFTRFNSTLKCILPSPMKL